MKSDCIIIDGKQHAGEILEFTTKKINEIKEIVPHLQLGLAVIRVGEDTASSIYVRNKAKKAEEMGIQSHVLEFDAMVEEATIMQSISELNSRNDITGILVQMPLPGHLNVQKIIDLVNPLKDVDGFSTNNVGLLNSWQDSLEPCTPQGVLMMLKKIFSGDLKGKKAVVLGRSRIVGRPMISMLIRENCTVTSLHSHSKNLEKECKEADIVVAAVGSPHLIKKEWIKTGACVIDVGIVRIDDKLYGDVDFQNAKEVAGFLTPVPGGVGPVTVACLMLNTVKAAYKQHRVIW